MWHSDFDRSMKKVGRIVLTEVITECAGYFNLSNSALIHGMCAIVNESYPEPLFIKYGNSNYQAQKSFIWTGQMGVESPPDVVQLNKVLVANMETNDFDPNDSYLRRGENAIQGMISIVKRKRNRVPISPLGLKKISEKGSPSDEENSEDTGLFLAGLSPCTYLMY